MSITNSKRRKIENENRTYQKRWECEYLITNNNGKIQCLVCMQVLSDPREFDLKRHYSSLNGVIFNKYDVESRVALVSDFKKKVKQQTGMFTKVAKVQTCSLAASYTVALELAKSNKQFSDGSLVKKCAIEMAKAFGDSGMAENFETLSLSHQTVARRVAHMDGHVRSKILAEKSV
jgi:nitrogenase subunit NifH